MKLILETEGLEYTLLQGSREIEVENLVYDSRKDCSNSLFVCMKGSKFDSHKDIDKVVKAGAKALVIEEDIKDLPSYSYLGKKLKKGAGTFISCIFRIPCKKTYFYCHNRNQGKDHKHLYVKDYTGKSRT